jgi:hypothetical protein
MIPAADPEAWLRPAASTAEFAIFNQKFWLVLGATISLAAFWFSPHVFPIRSVLRTIPMRS